ncbi:MAG: PAS domain-containing protein [Anaeromyxobacter sp.]
MHRTGLSPEVLQAGGIVLSDLDEPLFEGCNRAAAIPLAASGQLFGVVNLEYPAGAPGDPHADAQLLKQLANHAALGVRNLRSIEELTFLKTYLEDLIQHANALILAVNRRGEVMVWNGELASLTGVDRVEALGRPLIDRVAPEDRETLQAALEATLAGDALDGLPLRLQRAKGGDAPVVIDTAPSTAPRRWRACWPSARTWARSAPRRPPPSTPSGWPASAGWWRAWCTSSTTRSPPSPCTPRR